MTFHWLRTFLSSFVADDPFMGYVDYTPQASPRVAMRFHVALPSKYRPRVVSSHATRQEAEFAAMDEAAGFAAAGWFVNRAHSGLWQISCETSDGEFLFTKLEVLSTEQAIREEVS